MRRFLRAVFPLVPVLLCVGLRCSRSEPGRPLGVVLVLLDTVRADHLGCAGYERDTSPVIDRLAREGVRFEKVVSYAPWTLPSVAAMLSAEPAHLVFREKLTRSLVEDLSRAGVRTAAFTEDVYLDPGYGIGLGFDEYHSRHPFDDRDPLGRHAAARTFGEARAWLQARLNEAGRGERRPFFLLVHTYEPHAPYSRNDFLGDLQTGRIGDVLTIQELDRIRRGLLVPDETEREAIRALYDGGIREADRHVGELVGAIDGSGLADRVLVVVTSDHGEELGEHYPSRIGDHGHSLHDELLLVPLVLRGPLPAAAGGKVETPVRTLDVMPTVLDLLGVPVPDDVEGRSLVPLLRGERPPPLPAFGGSPHTGPDRTFVRHLGYKWIEVVGGELGDPPLLEKVPRYQLYDLRVDPGETRNLADERPDLVERFRKLNAGLGRGGGRGVEIGPLDEAARARLRELGYLR